MSAHRADDAIATLLYVATSGSDGATRARLPFAHAVMASETGLAIVHLRGDGVTLLRDAVTGSVVPIDLPPLCEIFRQVREHAVPVYV